MFVDRKENNCLPYFVFLISSASAGEIVLLVASTTEKLIFFVVSNVGSQSYADIIVTTATHI